MNEQYVVFLDIDGVFTSLRMEHANEYRGKLWSHFDPCAVQFMNRIHDNHDVEFVLISTWKDGIKVDDSMTLIWIEAAFRNAGFRGQFAKVWKTEDRFDADRAEGIKLFLDEHDYYADFIIFDDNDYDFNVILEKRRFVQTDPNNGILHKHMFNAMSIMGEWEKKHE